MTIVIDNSVLVKWFFPYGEEFLEKALEIKNDFGSRIIELTAPSIITYELGSVLSKAVHSKNLKRSKAEAVFDLFFESGIKLLDYEKLHQEGLKISSQRQITFYDASYVALSQMERAPLYTADKKLVNQMGHDYPLVRHLSAYSSLV